MDLSLSGGGGLIVQNTENPPPPPPLAMALHMLLGYDTVYILYNENTQDRTLSQDIAPSLKLCNYCVLINFGAQ